MGWNSLLIFFGCTEMDESDVDGSSEAKDLLKPTILDSAL